MTKARILMVEDDSAVLDAVTHYFERHGFEVLTAESCEEAGRVLAQCQPDVAIIDYSLPDGNALDLLPRAKAIDPAMPCVILTGHGSIELAVRAIKEGADQFLTKPIEMPTLLLVLERLLEGRRDRRRQMAGKATSVRHPINPFRGESQVIRQLADQAQRVLATESPLLITGETGTGKGVLARWLHEHGPRADEAFVDVNCAGLSRDLLESELFGYEKGAFTGAVGHKTGLLEVAHKGTVFLDEIGDVDPAVQPKLLKVLEEQRFRRLGSVEDRTVDIRLIAATHQDLAELVSARRFRDDLYYRINAITLRTPPLRERGEDVGILARYYLNQLAPPLAHRELSLSPAAEQALKGYHWPGNIRELRNVLERAILLARSPVLEPGDLALQPTARPPANAYDAGLTLDELERLHIAAVLRETGGRIEPAARRLGIHRSSLYGKLRKHRLDPSKN